MLFHDTHTRLQLARERADELSREYRRAQKPDADSGPRRPERLALRRRRLPPARARHHDLDFSARQA